jgi:hypothetical protein
MPPEAAPDLDISPPTQGADLTPSGLENEGPEFEKGTPTPPLALDVEGLGGNAACWFVVPPAVLLGSSGDRWRMN